MKISVCCPSLQRPHVVTLQYLPFCRVYVDPSEAAEYRRINPDAAIVECAPGIQGNVCRVRNHILDREFAAGADAVVTVDDDMTGIFYFEGGKEKHLLPGDRFLAFAEKYSRLALEWGFKMWGLNINMDPQCYRECCPFSTLSFLGGPFQAFLRGGECRYDERLPLKEDYDMTLQQLNRYRGVLRVNKFHYVVKQSEQCGGCATYRNLDAERDQLLLLRRKWGRRIVRCDTMDRSHKANAARVGTFDYNPIIKVPIGGV